MLSSSARLRRIDCGYLCTAGGVEHDPAGGKFLWCQIAISNEIENYPAIPSITGPELAQQIYAQAESLGAQIHFETVTQAELSANPKVVTTHTERYEAKAVIIANGVKRRKLGCPGEEAFTGRGVSYCATCDGAFFRGKDVAIVGGGNTALEDALYLANVCRTVYLVHRRDAFRGEKALADRVRQKENIKIQYDSAVSKIRGESAVSSVLLENTKTGAQQELPVSAVFVAIGLIPENEIFSRQLPLDDNAISSPERIAKPCSKACSSPGTAARSCFARSSLPRPTEQWRAIRRRPMSTGYKSFFAFLFSYAPNRLPRLCPAGIFSS